MNNHTVYQHNGSISLMNYNDRDDSDRNDSLHYGDVSSGVGLINIHALPQHNKSNNLNDMNMGVEH